MAATDITARRSGGPGTAAIRAPPCRLSGDGPGRRRRPHARIDRTEAEPGHPDGFGPAGRQIETPPLGTGSHAMFVPWRRQGRAHSVHDTRTRHVGEVHEEIPVGTNGDALSNRMPASHGGDAKQHAHGRADGVGDCRTIASNTRPFMGGILRLESVLNCDVSSSPYILAVGEHAGMLRVLRKITPLRRAGDGEGRLVGVEERQRPTVRRRVAPPPAVV